MKLQPLLPLLLCALLLAGCYRQAEEPFQQVDSVEVAAPVVVAEVSEEGETGEVINAQSVAADAPDEPTPNLEREYITPVVVPGQIDPPTPDLTIQETAVVLTAGPVIQITREPFSPPTPTLSFVEQLDPTAPCVYQIQYGDNLFRLSLDWATTVDEIMNLNQLDDDALSIGQLLLRPACGENADTAAAPAAPAEEPAEPVAEPAEPVTEPASETSDTAEESPAAADPAAEPEPWFHVVSSGETLESISLLYRIDVNELIRLNNLTDPNRLDIGQQLKLPDS